MSKKGKDKVEKVVKTEEPEAQPVTSTNTDAPVQLTLTDLQAAVSIIELASRRGAFQAQELATVGSIYNKLSAFLSAVNQQTQLAQQAQSGVESETPANENEEEAVSND